MSTDVASLVFEFNSTSAATADADMNRLIATGDKLEASALRVKTATEQAGIGIKSGADASTAATQSATDLAAAQGAVEKATRQATSASADTRAQRTLEAAAMRELVLATNQYENSQAALASKLSAVQGVLDPLAKIEKTRADQMAIFNKSLAAGLVNEGQYATLLKSSGDAALAAKTAHLEMATGVNAAEDALGHMGGTAGKTREALVLMREFMRGDFSRALGSTTIELQRFGLLGAIFSPVGLAIGALAIATGVVVAAMFEGEKEIAKFNGALVATGNYAGLTVSSMETMSDSISKASDTTIGATKKTVESLTETGKFSGAAIASLSDAAQNYSRITGQNADTFVKEYDEMGDHLVKFALKHQDVYHDLTFDQIQQIALLVKHGQEQAAQEALAADIDAASKKRLAETTAEQVANYGILQTSLHNIAINASSMWDALLGLGRPMTNVEKLGAAMDKLAADSARIQQARQTPLGNTAAARQLQDSALATDYANVSGAQGAIKTENDKAAADDAEAKKQRDLAQAKFGDGKATGKTPTDDNATTLDAAVKAELAAQLSLTADVDQIAKIKTDEVAAELKLQTDRVAKLASEHHITTDTATIADAAYQAAAAAKDELIERQKIIAQVQADLDQRQAVSGYQDRINAAQAIFATSAEQTAEAEEDALAERQAQEREATGLKLSENLASGKINIVQAAILLSMESEAQSAETAAKQRQDDIKIIEERAALQTSSLERQKSVAEAEASLLTSTYARAVAEKDILAITQQEELVQAQRAIDITTLGSAARKEAEDAMGGLQARQAADKKLADRQTDLIHGIQDATTNVSSLKDALARHDWATVFDDLQKTIHSIEASFTANGLVGGLLSGGSALATLAGGKTGNSLATGIGVAGLGLAAGGGLIDASLGAAEAGTISGALGGLGVEIGSLLGPIGIIAGIGVALAGILKSKPSNNTGIATFDGTSAFSVAGDKSTDNNPLATTAANAVIQGEQALASFGVTLNDTVTKIGIGSRDLSSIFLSSGAEVRSAVGDASAAAEAALKAVLQGATFTDDAEKKLVDSMLAAGDGFDQIATAIQNYVAAQQISTGIAAQIQQLQDPQAYDASQVRAAIDAQKASAQAMVTAGDLTTDQLAKINSQLDTLEGLQLDAVVKKYADTLNAAQQSAADAMTAANDNVTAAQSAVSDAYSAETSAIQSNIDALNSSITALSTFSDSLTSGPLANLNPTQQLATTRAQFEALAALPAADPTRLAGLQAASEAFLTASKAAAPTSLAYAQDLAQVKKATDDSVKAAQTQVSLAQQQLDADQQAVQGLITLNATVQAGTGALTAAIGGLQAALATQAAAQAAVNALATPAATATPDPTATAATSTAVNDNNAASNTNDPTLATSSVPTPADIQSAVQAAIQGGIGGADFGAVQHFATGGTGVVGGSGGTDSQDVHLALTPGELVNVKRPTGGDDTSDLAAEIRSLTEAVAKLQGSADQTAKNTDKSANLAARWDRGGLYVRGISPEAPVKTQAA